MTGTMRVILRGAEDMQQTAARYIPPAAIKTFINKDLKRTLPEIVRTLGLVWITFHQRATDPREGHPLPTSVMASLEALSGVQAKVAVAADRIGPLIEKLLQARLDEMQDARFRMWDQRANAGNPVPVGAAGNLDHVLIAAQELVKRAARYEKPEGIVELIDVEYKMLTEVMDALSRVWIMLYKQMADPETGVPVPESGLAAITALSVVQGRLGDAAEKIPALARKVVAARLEELEDRRIGMFDQAANEAA